MNSTHGGEASGTQMVESPIGVPPYAGSSKIPSLLKQLAKEFTAVIHIPTADIDV
jgi:hypothetical protein